MNHLNNVVYSQVMLNMSMKELICLNYQPDADSVHKRIYADKSFWQRKVANDFGIVVDKPTLNWRYIYWMLRKSKGDLKSAMIKACTKSDISGADLLAALGVKFTPDELPILDSKFNFKTAEQWQCMIKQ